MITSRMGVGRTQKAKKSKSRQMKRAINRLKPNSPSDRAKQSSDGTANSLKAFGFDIGEEAQ